MPLIATCWVPAALNWPGLQVGSHLPEQIFHSATGEKRREWNVSPSGADVQDVRMCTAGMARKPSGSLFGKIVIGLKYVVPGQIHILFPERFTAHALLHTCDPLQLISIE
jgi:hypothetical protein